MKIMVIISILIFISVSGCSVYVPGTTVTKASLKEKASIIHSDLMTLDDAWHRYSIKHNGDTSALETGQNLVPKLKPLYDEGILKSAPDCTDCRFDYYLHITWDLGGPTAAKDIAFSAFSFTGSLGQAAADELCALYNEMFSDIGHRILFQDVEGDDFPPAKQTFCYKRRADSPGSEEIVWITEYR
jgi:hypothetical protein